MLYFNARWLDPSLGRFTQADSIVPAGVQGYDRYAYVNNNPVRYTDPSGHKPCWATNSYSCDLTEKDISKLAESSNKNDQKFLSNYCQGRAGKRSCSWSFTFLGEDRDMNVSFGSFLIDLDDDPFSLISIITDYVPLQIVVGGALTAYKQSRGFYCSHLDEFEERVSNYIRRNPNQLLLVTYTYVEESVKLEFSPYVGVNIVGVLIVTPIHTEPRDSWMLETYVLHLTLRDIDAGKGFDWFSEQFGG